MRETLTVVLLLVLSAALPGTGAAESNAEDYWPQWRGPMATGVAPHGDPPIEWGPEKNIAWKVEIPGKGYASPIVWEDRVYVLTAVPAGKPALRSVRDARMCASSASSAGSRNGSPRCSRSEPVETRSSVNLRAISA